MSENDFFPAESQDLKSINDIISEHNKIFDRSYKPYHFNAEDIIESDKSIVFLSKEKDFLKGYLWLYSNQPFNNEKCEGKIIIVIAPTFRKSGVANKFINFIIEYAKNKTLIGKLIAEIKYDNIASKRLIEKYKFISEHENGFGCTMVLELKR